LDEFIEYCLLDIVNEFRLRLTKLAAFCMRVFLFDSFDLSVVLLSRASLTLAFTFCRKEATSFTLTSDSSNAAVISFRVPSRTLHACQNPAAQVFYGSRTDFLVYDRCSVKRRERSVELATQVGQYHLVPCVG
jgi:hypothetical protein